LKNKYIQIIVFGKVLKPFVSFVLYRAKEERWEVEKNIVRGIDQLL